MQNFKTPISLNSDLVVHCAAIQSWAKLRSWFTDCSGKGRVFAADWESKWAPHKASGATLFLYPHRNLGIYLSLGAKRDAHPKQGFKRKDARNHVDVLAVTDAVYLDDEQVYRNGALVVAQEGR